MRSITLALVAGIVAAAPLAAQSASVSDPGGRWVAVAPETRVWFTGASNIRHFTCRAADVRGRYRAAPGGVAADLLLGGHPATEAELVIPTAGLGCGLAPMNRHLRQALAAGEHPEIVLRIADYLAVAEPGDTSAVVRMEGTLAIAGLERPVSLHAVAVRDAAGRVHLSGEAPLRVTDWEVEPPRRFGGALRVQDTVTVHWDVVFPAPPTPVSDTRSASIP